MDKFVVVILIYPKDEEDHVKYLRTIL